MARWKPPRKADELPVVVPTNNWLSDAQIDWGEDDDWKKEISRAEMWRIDSGSLYDYTLVGGTEQLSYRLDDMLIAEETPMKVITNYGQLRDHINTVFHDQGPVKFCRMMQIWLTSKSLKDAIFLLMEPPGYLTSDIVAEIDDAWEANSRETMYP